MADAEPQAELAELLALLMDDALTDAQHARLAEILRSDPAARAWYRDIMHVHGMFYWRWQSMGEEDGPHQSPPLETTEAGDPDHAFQVPAPAAPGRRSASGARGWRGLVRDFIDQPAALAMLLLTMVAGGALIWGLSTLNRPAVVQQQAVEPPSAASPESSQPGAPNHQGADAPRSPGRIVARLKSQAKATWDGTAWQVGADLRAGQRLVLKSGLAEVDFDSGASVILEGPAEFELGAKGSGGRDQKGSNACSLSLGKLVALVPKQARGFTVQTPALRIMDLGTQFGVRVELPAKSEIGAPATAGHLKSEIPTTEVQVFQGEVELTPIADVAQADRPPTSDPRPPILLKAGEAIISQRDAAPRIVRAEPARFVRELPDEEPGASAHPLTAGDILAVCRSTLKLVKIDPRTGQQSLLVQGDRTRHGREWLCVAVDAQHRVYVGTEANRAVGGGQVLRIDPRDGSIAVAASGGLMSGGRINALVAAGDGTLLAAQDGLRDQILSILPETGDVSRVVEYGDNVWSIALDTGGRDFFIVSDGGPSGLVRYAGGQLTPWLTYEDPRNYRSVVMGAEGRVFVSYIHLEERNIVEVDRRTHELRPMVTLPAAQATLGQMAVEANGNLIVGSYGEKGEIFRVDAANKTAKLLAEGGQLQASGGVAVVPNR